MESSACTICAQEHLTVANIVQKQVNLGPLLSKLISAVSSTALVNDNALKSTCIVCAMELLRLQKFLSLVEKSQTLFSSVHEDKMVCKAEPEDEDFDCYNNGKVETMETQEIRVPEIESVFVESNYEKLDDFMTKSEEVILKEEMHDDMNSEDETASNDGASTKPFRSSKVRRSHNKSKRKFKCSMCPKEFARNRNLKQHMLLHIEEKRYQCDYCLKCFTFSHNLNRHLVMHSGEKPFRCDVCFKEFWQNSNLKKHHKIHSRPGHLNKIYFPNQ